jgi:hypothetical protein
MARNLIEGRGVSMKQKIVSLIALFLSIGAFADETLKLNDLGFTTPPPQELQAEQNDLDKRAHKLQLHQKLGLLTLGLAAGAALTAKEGEAAPETHEILGMTTAAVYFTTAYFSLTAPDSKSPNKVWNIKIHKAMAFIHFPCMVLLPFAGPDASKDYKAGREPDGLGKYKKTLANAALASMATAALVMTVDF